jgi:hypothetical protein
MPAVDDTRCVGGKMKIVVLLKNLKGAVKWRIWARLARPWYPHDNYLLVAHASPYFVTLEQSSHLAD